VTFRLGPANSLEIKNSTLYECNLAFGLRDVEEAPAPTASPAVPSDNANRIRLKDCELSECRLFRKITPSRTVPQWEGCTFTKMQLPEVVFSSDARAELTSAGARIVRCRFVDCEVPASFLLATIDCTFEKCTFTGQAPAQLKEAATINVAGTLPAGAPLGLRFTGASGGTGTMPGVTAVSQPGTASPTLAMSTGTVPLPATAVVGASTPLPPPSRPTYPSAAPRVAGSGLDLARNEARLHGLLIMELNSGHEAGQAAVMNAIALEDGSVQASRVVFNQSVGSHMTKALEEVTKHLQILHGGWPQGYRIELGFADKYSNKDGPSAAVACALLIDSLISGRQLDQSFAVTGDMNADGSVQPIGGVRAKIRGATNSQCKIVAIPAKNERALADLLLSEGPEPFAATQIFSIGKFEEARGLAYVEKDVAVQKAVSEMAQVLDLLKKNRVQMRGWLHDPRVVSKLQQALVDAPNHLSAKYLLMFAQGRTPTTLTLAGSLDAVDGGGSDIVGAIKAGGQGYSSLKTQTLGNSIGKLTLLRPKVDARVRPYLDGILRFANLVKDVQERPPGSASRSEEVASNIYSAAQNADSALATLLGDPAVVEELKR
jgi:hypothetical protein